MSDVAATPSGAVVEVLENLDLSDRYFMLRLRAPDDAWDGGLRAGQFIHLRVPEVGRFFLRRPFSVFDASNGEIKLLIAEAGAGTRAIRSLAPGRTVDFYGPLGGGAFPDPGGRRVLAVGGGVGLAPLYHYGVRGSGVMGRGYRLVYGARTRDDLFLDRIDLGVAGALLATDDGSFGYHGTAVALAREELMREGADVLFSCGPTPMMRAVERLAREMGLAHYASLENRMACALGACRACVVPMRSASDTAFRTVCHDGPVFDAAELAWDALPVL